MEDNGGKLARAEGTPTDTAPTGAGFSPGRMVWQMPRRGLARLALRMRAWVWERPTPPGPALRVLQAVLLTNRAFGRNDLAMFASGLSFSLLISVVPFLSVLFLVLRPFEVADRLQPYLYTFVAGGNPEIMARISGYVEAVQGGAFGGLGIFATLVMGFIMLQRLKHTLNIIWEVERTATYRHRLIEYGVMLIVLPLLLGGALTVSGLLSSAPLLDGQGFGMLRELLGADLIFLGNAVSLLMLLVVVFYAYRYLPDSPVWVWAAWLGAILATLALRLVERFFLGVAFGMFDYSKVYGALAALPLLMLWFFLGWLIFLYCAQLVCVVQHFPRFVEQRRRGGRMVEDRAYLAVLALAVLWRGFESSGKPVHWRAMATALALPRNVVRRELDALVHTRLITPVQGMPGAFVPAEMMDGVSLAAVLARLRRLPGLPTGTGWNGMMPSPALGALYMRANHALVGALDEVSVAELASTLHDTSARDDGEGAGE